MHFKTVWVGLALTLVTAQTKAEESESRFAPMRAFVNWEIGQIEQGVSAAAGVIDKEIIDHASVWVLQEARLADNAKVFFGVGAAYFYVFPRNLGSNPYAHSRRSGVGLTDAHGEFKFFGMDDGDHGLLLKAGIFPFKYNENAKNLGEYMFRTYTYPNVISTGGFEFVNSAATQLSGFDFNTRVSGFQNDLLLTFQTGRPPVLGLSLTDIVSYEVGAFKFGLGYMFDNFYHTDEETVQPKAAANAYYVLSNGRELAASRYEFEIQNGLIIDPAIVPVDTGYYTLAGQKAMAFGSLDIGTFMGMEKGQFGVYGEAIVMGIKDYPTYYENINDRIAYMVGANIPTFGLLDQVTLEYEVSKNPFENTTIGPIGTKSITPAISAESWGSYMPVTEDDNKWTVYARKSIYEGFAIHAQVAQDHIRMFDVFSTPDFAEFMPNKSDWYWVFKLSYAI